MTGTTAPSAALESLQTFPGRLLMALHGIAEASLADRPPGHRSILEVMETMVEDELRSLTIARNRARLARPRAMDQTGAELRALRALLLATLEYLPPNGAVTAIAALQQDRIAEIEAIKSALGVEPSTEPDTTRVTAGRPEDAEPRSPGEGILIRKLWSEGSRQALLVEIAPGARWPSLDYHVPGPEEVYVLSGDFHDGVSTWKAGTFLHHPAGSSHLPGSATGCSLLVYYPEG